MKAGGQIPWGGIASGAGALLGALFGGDDYPQSGQVPFMDKNKRLAMALMQARLGQKLNLPMRPRLPEGMGQFQSKNDAMANALARVRRGEL